MTFPPVFKKHLIDKREYFQQMVWNKWTFTGKKKKKKKKTQKESRHRPYNLEKI